MEKHPLTRGFETSGDWFLPDRPDRVVGGVLKYMPDQYASLEVHDAFTPLKPGPLAPGPTYALICGTTRDGQAVTLLDAKSMGLSIHAGTGGFRYGERLLSTIVLLGGQCTEPPNFKSLSMRVPGLQVWHARQLIEIQHSPPDAPEGFAISYRIPKPTQEVIRVESIAANVEFGISYSANMDMFSTINATVGAWATVRSDEPQPIDWFLRQHRILSTMLGFLAGSTMSPDYIQASESGDSRANVDMLVSLKDQQLCAYKNPHEFFITRDHLGVDLPTVLGRWFELFPSMQAPSQLASSVFASEKLWLHVEFLSLMQALEGFHRAVGTGTYMDPVGYSTVRKELEDAIPEGVSSGHRAALMSKIKYGNELSLGKRLEQLVERLSKPIRSAIFGPLGKVPREWIDTRNYYTHWDKELKQSALDGKAMYEANVRLRAFLRVLYLDSMGVPQPAIVGALRGSNTAAQHLMQLNTTGER